MRDSATLRRSILRLIAGATLAVIPVVAQETPPTREQVVQLLPSALQANGRAMLNPKLSADSRLEVASELAASDPEFVTGFLLQALRIEQSAAIRTVIVGSLDIDYSPGVRDALESALSDPDERVRRTAGARVAWAAKLAARQAAPNSLTAPVATVAAAPTPAAQAAALLIDAGMARDIAVADSYAVAVLGDFGTAGAESSSAQQRVANAMRAYHGQTPFTFGITVGDNFYESGLDSATHERWQVDWVVPYKGLPDFYAVAGNHDWRSGDNVAALIERGLTAENENWRMPARYYTLRAGAAQFFAIDTTDMHKGKDSAQLQWLTDQLRASTAKWKIVYGHHPFLSGGAGHGKGKKFSLPEDGEIERLRNKVLLPVLKAGGAHLYFAGHDHEGQLLKVDGVYQAINGGGGRGADDVIRLPETVYCARGNGFSVLKISADALEVEFKRIDAKTGSKDFSCRLTRDAAGGVVHTCPSQTGCWK